MRTGSCVTTEPTASSQTHAGDDEDDAGVEALLGRGLGQVADDHRVVEAEAEAAATGIDGSGSPAAR